MKMDQPQLMQRTMRRIVTLEHTQPTIERRYALMGETLLFQTNDPLLQEAADEAFGRFPACPENASDPLVVRLFVHQVDQEPARLEGNSWPDPIYRTQEHLFYYTIGADNAAVVDLSRGFAYGFITPQMARDRAYVRVTFIEAMGLAMLGTARKFSYIHAACVVKDGVSMVIQGQNGAGKSTLAYACARRGYKILAEDVVYAKIRPEGPLLWGMPWKIHLLPDARQFFPELAGQEARLQINGEMKLEFDLEDFWPGSTVTSTEPGLAILVKHGTHGPTYIEPVSFDQALQEAEVLWMWMTGWSDEHERGTQQLFEGGVYNLHVNDAPDKVVDALDHLVDTVRRGKTHP